MKINKLKFLTPLVFMAGISIFVGMFFFEARSMPSPTHSPLISPMTQPRTPVSSTPSMALSSPTSPPLSVNPIENLFGNSSCSLPCWQGITPGVTTSSEALERLNSSSLVLRNSIQSEESKTGLGRVDWRWKIEDKQPDEKGNMVWADGIVRMMELTTYYPNISIGEVINKFGPPEKIDTIDCTDVPEAGHQYWCVTLYYAKNGLEIHFTCEGAWDENDMDITQITQSDPIEFIRLFEPTTIEKWLLSIGLDPQHLNLRDWKGYGNLIDLYVR